MQRWQGMIASQPHLARASGENLRLYATEPKVEQMIVNLVPIQNGSGTPGPNNVRSIEGHTHTDALGGFYYGGTLNLVTGELYITYGALTVDSGTVINGNTSGDFLYINMGNTLPFKHSTTAPHPIAYCDKLEIVSTRARTRTTSGLGEYDGGNYYSYIYVWDIAKLYPSAKTKAAAISALRSLAPTWVFELENPQFRQLDPQSVRLVRGWQNVTMGPGTTIDIAYYTI